MEYYLSTKAFKNLSDTSYLSLRFLNALVDRQHSIATFGLLLGSSIVLITPCHIPDIRHLNKSVTSKCCYIKIVVQPSELVKIITMAKKLSLKSIILTKYFRQFFLRWIMDISALWLCFLLQIPVSFFIWMWHELTRLKKVLLHLHWVRLYLSKKGRYSLWKTYLSIKENNIESVCWCHKICI